MEKSIHTARYALLLELLAAARRNAGVTQEQLAERLSITQSSVSKVERGERRMDIVELFDWCHALGHPFNEFAAEFEKRVHGKS
jgi:transcriptional regulator with XRE-family HTH domain